MTLSELHQKIDSLFGKYHDVEIYLKYYPPNKYEEHDGRPEYVELTSITVEHLPGKGQVLVIE